MGEKDDVGEDMIGKIIFDRYKLTKKIGSGTFGSIYCAECDNKLYVIKFEGKNRKYNLLQNEATIMSYLHCPGIPAVISYECSSEYNILVMELMGKSLEEIFENFIFKKMSVRCVCNIGYQIIEILEFIHNKNIIHRDIKPDNFVIGRNYKKKYIYLLDFGLSKKYRCSETLKHYTLLKNKNLIGTARYASINALNGLTQSRRDDLEAVGYLLLYFLRGKLPWQGIHVKTKEERNMKIMQKKIDTSAQQLCKGFPLEFERYVEYTRNLQYEENPDYKYLKNLFLNVLNNQGFNLDCYYDWDTETIIYNRNFNSNKGNNKMMVNNENISNNVSINKTHSNDIKSNASESLLKYNLSLSNNFSSSKQNYFNFDQKRSITTPLPIRKIQERGNLNDVNMQNNPITRNAEINPQLMNSNLNQNATMNNENVNYHKNPMNAAGEKENSCCIII